MNVDSEIKITKEFLDEARSFTFELEKVISQYFGFNVTFPLEEQEENLIINAKVDYPITIPAIQKNITSELIKQIVILLYRFRLIFRSLAIRRMTAIRFAMFAFFILRSCS